jgi:hypothetical protein
MSTMKQNSHTEEMIAELVSVTCGEDASVRETHTFREALRSLVRLAKAEQMCEMKTDIQSLTAAPTDVILH